MRIRSTKPEFWASQLIARWPYESRLCYIALWNEADDEGRFRAAMAYLKGRLFPYESFNMGEVLAPLVTSRRVILYTAGGEDFGFLPTFRRHQRINRPSPSKLPPPPEGALTEESVSDHGALMEDSPQEGKGTGSREQGTGKGKEQGETRPADRPPAALPLLVGIWNENRGALPEAKGVSKNRLAQIRARLVEEPDPLVWASIVQRIAASPFCCGENDRGWRASFDWLIQPDTLLKVLEGKYDPTARGKNERGALVAGPDASRKTLEEIDREYLAEQARGAR